MRTRTTSELSVQGRKITVANLDKVLYPAAHFTKAHVIDYYIRIADYILPHVRNRPVTLKRFPDGVTGEFFYEKDAPKFTPAWVRTFPVPRRDGTNTNINYIVIEDLPTLTWLANLANLEIHPFLHKVPHLDRPTSVVFDLDPGPSADILNCARIAFLLRELLSDLRLESFVKVSGSKGLQVYVPLNTDAATYAATQPFAKAVAEFLEHRHPSLAISKMAKTVRRGKVFIDWSQNADFKTTVGVYSLRAKLAQPFVSLPIEWDELDAAVKADDAKRLYFKPDAALKRIQQKGDLFSPVLTLRQKVPQDFVDRPSTRKTGAVRRTPAAGIRRSRQGSRRRFEIRKASAKRPQHELCLEMNHEVKCLTVRKGLPRKTDAGTYQLMEGSYAKGHMRIYFDGSQLKGEWTLQRTAAGENDKWSLTKTDRFAAKTPVLERRGARAK